MRIAGILIATILAAGVGLALWVRISGTDPAVWHVDPDSVTARGARNSFLVRDAGGDVPALRLSAPPAEVAARIDAIALATPRTVRLAGAEGWVSYVSRSAVWGFPDVTSLRVAPDGGGSVVTVFARSRFGDSDFGVNRARVEGWLAQLSG